MKIRRTYIGPDYSFSIEVPLNRDTIKKLERVVNEDLTNHVEITLQEIIDYYEQKPNHTLDTYYTNNSTIGDILGLSIDCLIRLRAAELGFENIDLPYEEEFIVVQFEGGGISVRNATGNSTVANVAELAKLLNGGYYDEVEYYKKRKEQQNEKK